MKQLLMLSVYVTLTASLVCANTNLNISVFGGGGGNAYAALYLAEEFSRRANMPFHKLFDQAWGLSGGTFSAHILMDARWDGKAAAIARSGIGSAFPKITEFLDPTDEKGARKNNFEAILEPYFNDQYFGQQKANVVFIGSLKGAPVYFCDNNIQLPREELRCAEGTSVVDGIMSSSTYSYRFFGMATTQLSLFKPRKILILPLMKQKTIIDGSHCVPKRDGKYVLDGVTPTPLVIDYLLTIPGRHNVVVFDNGGPYSDEFRKSIGMNKLGIANIKSAHSSIDIYIISVSVKNFAANLLNGSKDYVQYLEKQVHKSLNGHSKEAFILALRAVTTSKLPSHEIDTGENTAKDVSNMTCQRAKL